MTLCYHEIQKYVLSPDYRLLGMHTSKSRISFQGKEVELCVQCANISFYQKHCFLQKRIHHVWKVWSYCTEESKIEWLTPMPETMDNMNYLNHFKNAYILPHGHQFHRRISGKEFITRQMTAVKKLIGVDIHLR